MTGLDDPIFFVGMLFTNRKLLKDAINNVVIKDMVNIHLVKNDKGRLMVVCVKPCPCMIYARKFNDDDNRFNVRIYLQLKSQLLQRLLK